MRAVAFGAMGTAGQRCTTLRRLIVHDSVYDALVPKLVSVYRAISVGDPTASDALVGPLIDGDAFAAMQKALAAAKAAGGIVHGGERVDVNGPAAFYARPALVEVPAQVGPVLEETFAPILYVLKYRDFDEAIALQNGVPQGLSSSIFATDIREVERFLSSRRRRLRHRQRQHGHLGGRDRRRLRRREGDRRRPRERLRRLEGLHVSRQTNAVNYGRSLPLAQGVKFDV